MPEVDGLVGPRSTTTGTAAPATVSLVRGPTMLTVGWGLLTLTVTPEEPLGPLP